MALIGLKNNYQNTFPLQPLQYACQHQLLNKLCGWGFVPYALRLCQMPRCNAEAESTITLETPEEGKKLETAQRARGGSQRVLKRLSEAN
jgi:hypothetical protein